MKINMCKALIVSCYFIFTWKYAKSFTFDDERGAVFCNKYYKDLDGKEYGYWLKGMKSENTTIAMEFSNNGAQDVVQRFLKKFEIVANSLSKFTKNTRECKSHYKNIQDRTEFFGFGKLPKCTIVRNKTSIQELKGIEQSLIDDIELVKNKGEMVRENVLASYNLYKWKGLAFVNDVYRVLDKRIVKIRKCSAYRAMGIRVNGTWGLAVSLYWKDEKWHAGKYDRIFLTEFVTINEGKLGQHEMNYPTCKGTDDDTRDFLGRDKGTAAKERGVAQVKWDHFKRSLEHLEDHSGLVPALEEGSRHRELLQDSSAASNIAILLLPGLLTLFPIGLFQEATLRTIIPYSIATDIISVLPIIIKGSEMIHYARKVYFGNEIRFHGSENLNDIAVVQFLPAKCQFKNTPLIIGSILVCIGLVLMILGLVLEYLSIVRLEQKKSEDYNDSNQEDHGLIWYWNKKE